MGENITSPVVGATPAPGTPATGITASTGATPTPKPAATYEEALARIAELEHASKNAVEERDRHRIKLTKYEEEAAAAKKAAEEAQLSEIERAKKQLVDEQAKHAAEVQQMRDRVVRYEVEKQAGKLGAKDPAIVARLVDNKELELADDGTPTNAEEVLKKLLISAPFLFAESAEQQKPAGGAQQAPSTPPMNHGRTNIQSPTTATPGKIPRLTDPGILKRNRS